MGLEYIIENFDQLIIYFVPASIFLFTFKIISREAPNTKLFSPETVVLSYGMTSVVRFFYPESNVFFILVLAAAAGIFCALVKNSRTFEVLIRKTLKKVYWTNVWHGITDYKHGDYLHLFIEGSDISYRGAYRSDYKDDDGHTWLILSNYRMFRGYDIAGDGGDSLVTIEDFREDDTKRIAIDTSKVCRAAIRYHDDSVKIK